MKTLRLTFSLIGRQSDAQSILGRAEREMTDRRLKVNRVGEQLIASYVHENWAKTADDRIAGRDCPENTYWSLLIGGMALTNVTAGYTNALLPSGRRDDYGLGSASFWRNGESYWGRDYPYKIVVTCLPTPKIVTVSMDVAAQLSSGSFDKLNALRVDFLEVEWQIEKMIKRTRAALRLAKAFRSKPQDRGRIARFEHELFLQIGRP